MEIRRIRRRRGESSLLTVAANNVRQAVSTTYLAHAYL